MLSFAIFDGKDLPQYSKRTVNSEHFLVEFLKEIFLCIGSFNKGLFLSAMI